MSTIGERIKEIRKEQKLTQTEFSELFGLSHSHISNIEHDRENPSETLIKFISYKFNINYEWLRNGLGAKTPECGQSRRGHINRFNSVREKFETCYEYLTDDQLAEYTDAAWYALEFIYVNCADCYTEQLETDRLLDVLKHQHEFFRLAWLLNVDSYALRNNTDIIVEDYADYMKKSSKLMPEIMNSLSQLQNLIIINEHNQNE